MKRILSSLCLSLTFLLFYCSTTKEKIPPVSQEEQASGKMIIYQLLPRLFGNKISTNAPYGTLPENGVGKFEDITEAALTSLKEMGITHVW
jgi:hypothetical protein